MLLGILMLFITGAGCFDNRMDYRVVNGVPAEPGECPYIAYLIRINGIRPVCGATIYSARTVLTAAHCLASQHPKMLNIVIGIQDVRNRTNWDTYAVRKIKIHPQYIGKARVGGNYKNDIGLVYSIVPFEFGPKAKIAQTATVDYPIGQEVIAFGWGATRSGGPGSSVLLKTTLNIVDTMMCYHSLIMYDMEVDITGGNVCAYGETRDTCQGDSGGPLFVNTSTGLVLVGITSWGRGCASPGLPGVYTRVSNFQDWIRWNSASCKSPGDFLLIVVVIISLIQ